MFFGTGTAGEATDGAADGAADGAVGWTAGGATDGTMGRTKPGTMGKMEESGGVSSGGGQSSQCWQLSLSCCVTLDTRS